LIGEEVRHLAIRNQTDALGFEPCLQGQHQGVILVVDGSLDPRKRFDAGKLEHEIEYHRCVTGIKNYNNFCSGMICAVSAGLRQEGAYGFCPQPSFASSLSALLDC